MPDPTFESVSAACQEVRQSGQKVTLKRVTEVHRGSPNRISPFWSQWKREQAEAGQKLDGENDNDETALDEEAAAVDQTIKRATDILRPILESFVKRQRDRYLDFTAAHHISMEHAVKRVRDELQTRLEDADERFGLVQEEFEAEKAALVAAHLNEIKLLKDELSRTESELLRSRTAAEARWVEAQGHRKEVAAAQGELKRLEAVLADRNAALESANQFIGQLKKRLSEFK